MHLPRPEQLSKCGRRGAETTTYGIGEVTVICEAQFLRETREVDVCLAEPLERHAQPPGELVLMQGLSGP